MGTVTAAAEKKTQQATDAKSERKPMRGRPEDKFKIFSGTANQALAEEVCTFLGLPSTLR